MTPGRMRTMKEFYPYYLGEHRGTATRVLHFIGTCAFLVSAGFAIYLGNPQLWLFGAVSAYACAWVGHFFFEHNRPATFKYPLLSLVSDFRFCFEVLIGKQRLRR